MHIYVRKLNSVTTTEYTTTTTTTYILQVKEDTRKGVIMHRYGKIVHAHYDKSLMGVIKPEDTVKHIQKMFKLYKQRKAGK